MSNITQHAELNRYLKELIADVITAPNEDTMRAVLKKIGIYNIAVERQIYDFEKTVALRVSMQGEAKDMIAANEQAHGWLIESTEGRTIGDVVHNSYDSKPLRITDYDGIERNIVIRLNVHD